MMRARLAAFASVHKEDKMKVNRKFLDKHVETAAIVFLVCVELALLSVFPWRWVAVLQFIASVIWVVRGMFLHSRAEKTQVQTLP